MGTVLSFDWIMEVYKISFGDGKVVTMALPAPQYTIASGTVCGGGGGGGGGGRGWGGHCSCARVYYSLRHFTCIGHFCRSLL